MLLPRYNGRNRTFFFVSYEGFRNRTPSQTLGRIPTANAPVRGFIEQEI